MCLFSLSLQLCHGHSARGEGGNQEACEAFSERDIRKEGVQRTPTHEDGEPQKCECSNLPPLPLPPMFFSFLSSHHSLFLVTCIPPSLFDPLISGSNRVRSVEPLQTHVKLPYSLSVILCLAIPYMWQSRVGIEHYCVAYFDCLPCSKRSSAELPLRTWLIHAV